MQKEETLKSLRGLEPQPQPTDMIGKQIIYSIIKRLPVYAYQYELLPYIKKTKLECL